MNQRVLLLFVRLGKNAGAGRTSCIRHFEDSSYYIVTEEDILIKNRNTAMFVKNEHKPFLFHGNMFPVHANARLHDIHVLHLKQDKKVSNLSATSWHKNLPYKKTPTPLCLRLTVLCAFSTTLQGEL